MFINPKTDFAFKKIFGSEESNGILISFLNALLFQGKAVIDTVQILTPYATPPVRGFKKNHLAVRVWLRPGVVEPEPSMLLSRPIPTKIVVKIQILSNEGFESRLLAKTVAEIQHPRHEPIAAEPDDMLDFPLPYDPVIALTITDFCLFDGSDTVISHVVLKDKDWLMDYPIHDLDLVFVELPKFTKTIDDLETLTDQWIFFLKHAPDLRAVPDNLGTVAEIQQAFALANQATLTPEELHEVEQRE